MTEEPGLRLNPLSVASTDDLIAELRGRYEHGLLVVGVCDTPGEHTETFFCDFAHGLTVCIGLAERARARLVQRALECEAADEER